MKKTICFVLLFITCIYLISCSMGYSNNNQITEICEHEYDEPTCTDNAVCKKCGKLIAYKLGHTTDAGQCERCGKWFGYWETTYYVDDFGDYTNKKYVRANVSGTFSNTATDGSRLDVTFIVDKDSFSIKLYEYGSTVVKNAYSHSTDYCIKIKADNESTELSGVMYSNSDRIKLTKISEDIMMRYLNSAKEIKFVIYPKDRKTTKYNFSVLCSNFPNEIKNVRN